MVSPKQGKGAQVTGVVEAALPQGLFRVKTDDGTKLTVSLSGIPKQTIVRIIPGDRILV
jgi:translation initiation factor IF-1